MKLLNILTKVGTAIIKDVVPGGEAIIDAVNALLPADKKLGNDATGHQVSAAITTLDPNQQAAILSKEFDVEIASINAWAQVQGTLAEADKAGASTRPQIAGWMAFCVVIAVLAGVVGWIMAVYQKDAAALKELQGSWPLLLTIIGTPTALLRAYFGMRTKEKRHRYSAATGVQAPNLLADIVKAIKG